MDQQTKLSRSQVEPDRSSFETKSPAPLECHVKISPPPEKASVPPITQNSYSTRLASYTSWPETCPTASDMAEAGFHQQPDDVYPDFARCSQCHLELVDWKYDDDPLDEHVLRSPTCSFLRPPTEKSGLTFSQTTPVSTTTTWTSKSPKTSMASLTSMETSGTSAPPAVAAVISTSSRPTTSPPQSCSIPPKPHQTLSPNCENKAQNTLTKADSSGESMEQAVLEVEDWEELGFDGEEKDEWVKV